MASAAAGDPTAIGSLASEPERAGLAVLHRLAPLLLVIGHQHGLEPPTAWSDIARTTAVMRLMLEDGLRELGAVLGDAGIPWLPLKGMGPVARLYPQPECRPTTDIDVLIPETEFTRARALLRTTGWEDMNTGIAFEDFLLREGYNWQARNRRGIMLELHFRLWGSVDPALATTLMERAAPAPELGATALVSGPVETHVMAAAHLWNSPRPVALLNFLDLELLARAAGGPGFVEGVASLARRHDLQLFVGLAAAVANQLWENQYNEAIAATLLGDLRPAERLAVARARRRSPLELSLGTLVLARLLSGRRSRSGWRAPFRQLWPHPAICAKNPGKGPIAAIRRALTSGR